MAHKVEIYVTMGCPYCQKAMAWLDKYKVENTRTVFNTFAEKQEFYQKHGVSTVPQIFVDGKLIGGWSDLSESAFKKEIEDNFQG